MVYPIGLSLEGKRCLVVGGGAVAERKINRLLKSKADLTIIALEPRKSLIKLADDNSIELHNRAYIPPEGKDYFLVVAATNNRQVNKQIYNDASLGDRLVNVVDSPQLSNFYVPASIGQGALQLTISTGGEAPALMEILKNKFQQYVDIQNFDTLIKIVGDYRRFLKLHVDSSDTRGALLNDLIESSKFTNSLEKRDYSLLKSYIEKLKDDMLNG